MLSKVLNQEDTVLFVGSGISQWSGLPSWSRLIEELAEFLEGCGLSGALVRGELARGDLLQAASFALDQLTKAQLGAFVRKVCRLGGAEPHEIHRLIVSLGPRCFITTNYDDLLERAIRKWQPDRYCKIVTNRQLTETADIIHARASDFVFKPHGDVNDSDSIILTREQYRDLLPQGERYAALEALRTLLVSRPVVYVGFGLRDPDFLFIKDLIANTYRGGARDHYAIVPDIDDLEIGYWRRNYGIHIATYESMPGSSPDVVHACLIEMLRGLSAISRTSNVSDDFEASSATTILALARHAAVVEAAATKKSRELPIRVVGHSKDSRAYAGFNPRNRALVSEFLDKAEQDYLLIGLPGSGKTYALRQAAARQAAHLHRCMLVGGGDVSAGIPIFVDLKLYGGSLAKLVCDALPSNLPLDEIYQHFNIKIYADSFNEMPREYRESGAYEQDFAIFVEKYPKIVLIIGSRTVDGLEKLELPVFALEEIDQEVVEEQLAITGIDISGRFTHELVTILQKPFFFQLVVRGLASLSSEPHPRDLYASLLANLQRDFEERFDYAFSLESILAKAAFAAIDRGEEAFPLVELLAAFESQAMQAGVEKREFKLFANWLVSKEILVPYSGGRVAFLHQSITEYLAAQELARRYAMDPDAIKQKLKLRRWDQALFLALCHLPRELSHTFLEAVVAVDFEMALTAAKYVESGRDELVSSLLSQVRHRTKVRSGDSHRLEWVLAGVPVTEAHIEQLRELLALGDAVGGVAAKKLIDVIGEAAKQEIFRFLLDHPGDYNFGANGAGPALASIAKPSDLIVAQDLINSLKVTDPFDVEDYHGFTEAMGRMLASIDLQTVAAALLPQSILCPLDTVRAEVLRGRILMERSQKALDVALALWDVGYEDAVFALNLISNSSKVELSWARFSAAHARKLSQMAVMAHANDGCWALDVLRKLCASNEGARVAVRDFATHCSGLARAALNSVAGEEHEEEIEAALWAIVRSGATALSSQPISVIRELKFSWAGHEDLFVSLCRLRDYKLLYDLADAAHFQGLRGDGTLGALEIGDIEFWLEWLASDPYSLLGDRFGFLFVWHLPKEKQNEFLIEFNKPTTRYRRVLAHKILLRWKELTTNGFSRDAISFLLSELSLDNWPYDLHGSLLGATATEQFVSEHLLPLLYDNNEQIRRNLGKVLIEAGRRHGIRYSAS